MTARDDGVDPCGACAEPLAPVRRDFGLLWLCHRCEAAYATVPVLKRLLGPGATRQLFERQATPEPGTIACPFCAAQPIQASCEAGGETLRLVFCRSCHAARLERELLESIVIRRAGPAEEATRRDEARTRVALLSLLQRLQRL